MALRSVYYLTGSLDDPVVEDQRHHHHHWRLVLHHNTEGGLFSGYEDAGHRSEDEDSADLYSVLSTLEDFRGDDGKLHFKLCYPEVRWAETADRCNEWRQQSNPYTSTEIRGFEAVGKLAFPHQSECRPWKVGTCRY